MLYVNPDRPFDPLTVAVIREVVTACRSLALDYVLAGATARDILLSHVFGIETNLATRDVDFAVAVQSWEQVESLKSKLVDQGSFATAKGSAHRLYYIAAGTKSRYPVDIIAFGGIEEPVGTIVWPPDKAVIMNVTGFRETLASMITVRIIEGLEVSLASLPGLALLKLLAWKDRGRGDARDARDLALLLRTYHDAGNRNRLYEEELQLLESVEYDLELAGPRLLGKDIANMTIGSTSTSVSQILNDEAMFNRLSTDIARGLGAYDDPVAAAENLLKQLRIGFSGQ